jgi:hypothetical protein
MRPVTKIPGNSIAVTAFYTVPATFTFAGAPGTACQALLHTKTPTVAAALAKWQQINRKAKDTLTANEKKLKKAIGAKVADIYKEAGPALAFFLGSYCSYCETTIAQLGEVEHVRPKSILGIQALSWDNFLLACGPCNNAKSNKPSRGDVKTLLGLGALPTDGEYQQALSDYYMWPDQDSESYIWMTYELARVNAGVVTALSGGEQMSLRHQNVVYNPVARTVTADIYNPASNTHTNYSVRVNITGTGQGHAGRAAAAPRTADSTELNELRGDRDTYDSRVNRKTRVWFDALNAITRIRAFTPANSNAAIYNMMWDQVMDTARQAGFYSTWLTVFFRWPNTTHYGDIYNAKFITLTTNNNFRATNKTDLPTN